MIAFGHTGTAAGALEAHDERTGSVDSPSGDAMVP
jgi:hypothetical protein